MGPPSKALLALAAALVAGLPGTAAGEPSLSLAALLAEAEASSPALRAAAARVAAAETLPDQATALPDPMVSLGLENESLDEWTLGHSEMSNLTLSWSQEVPSRAKRNVRADAARAEAAVVAADGARLRAELRARIKAAYVELHRIHRVRGLVGESRDLLVSLRDLSRARFEAGEAALEGTLAAGAEVARLDVTLAELDGERAGIEARLAAWLGRKERGSFGTARDAALEAPFDAAELARAAAEGSTRVAALRAAIRRDEARVEALGREAKPEFSWTAGYGYREELDPIVSGMVGVRLPVHRDRKQHQAVHQAERALQALREDAAQAEVDAAAEVREALARAASAEARALLIEQAVAPQERSALEAVTTAYSTGRADFGMVLDHVRVHVADERQAQDLRALRQTVLALLEPSVGRELILPAMEPR